MRRMLLTVLILAGLVIPSSLAFNPSIVGDVRAESQPPPGANTLTEAQTWSLPPLLSKEALSASVISVTDADFSGFSACSDCSNGWADDTWELTLTRERVVTFLVEDCCIVGDYYELWVDGKLKGTTGKVALYGPDLSSGTFAVTLKGGTHQIQIRNAAFATFSPDVLAFMCPAGFFLTWTLSDVPNPWWQGVLGALTGVAKKIGSTAAELIARFKHWGSAWEGLVAGWQIFKAGQLGDNFNNPDYRARLIDEAYNSSEAGPVWRERVDQGAQLGCVLIGCTATSWNELTYDQKRNEDVWLGVCTSVGGGYCSGYLLPAFMSKWLE